MHLSRMACVLALIGASLWKPTPAPAQTDLTGFWALKIPVGDGNFRTTYLDLTQSGDQIRGRSIAGKRETSITEGSISDGRVHFLATGQREGKPFAITYEGTVEKDRLILSIRFPGRDTIHGEAERSSPEAAKPPAPLPVPALHDVPDNGLARTPPMGWNSWNKFAGKVDDMSVRGMAEAMVSSGMRDAGYVYVNIDDTWQGQRDASGNITANKKFPDMKALTDYIHSKGMKAGIYSSPGPKTCAGYEGSFGHEEQDAKQWAAWGFDYVKYDWCSAGDIYQNADMRGVYQKMGDALLKTGRPIVYSLCQYGMLDVWTWGSKVGGNLWRTTGDISDNWKSLDEIGFSQLKIAAYPAAGHWNDPDMLEVGNGGMTHDEYKTHMSLWALLSAPLLAGNDLRSMSAETKAILMNKDVIAINQDSAAKPVRQIAGEGPTVTVARSMSDGSTVIGLFNRGGETARVSVSLSGLGLPESTAGARDLWSHQRVKLSGGKYDTDVPPHGVVLLKVGEL